MRIEAVTALFADLDEPELRLWVERGWVLPEGEAEAWEFQEIDIARVRLLHTLRRDLEVGEDSMPVVLSLLDQLYDMRRRLKRLLEAVDRQQPGLRASLLEELSRGA
ncbi:MAG TPA: chaperone modulator CbpM [Acetobacteraceae bacterium]|nr:chaperone modulator CbpM [Acetobacteraceae bacterium]